MTPRAFFLLAFYFVRQVLVRLFGRPGGLARFEENYRKDRLFPLTDDERQCFAATSRCIACGLCDAELARQAYATAESPRPATKPGAAELVFIRPSDLALSFTRSLPDLDATEPWVSVLQRHDLARLAAVCPVSVPFPRLVRTLADRLAREPKRADRGASDSQNVTSRDSEDDSGRSRIDPRINPPTAP